MNDNGIKGDKVAGDGIYSSDFLTFNPENGHYRGNEEIGGVSISYLFLFQLKNGLVDYYINLGNRSPTIAFCSEGNSPARFVQLDNSVYISDYLINVVSPKATKEHNLDELSTIYKKLLFTKNIDDTFDFVNWFFPESYVTGNRHTSIQQNIQGIGGELFDNSDQWGSNKKLIGTTSFYNLNIEYPIVHETMHQWGNFMDIFQHEEYLGHWGYSSVNGILGGFKESELEIICDTLVRISQNYFSPYGWGFNTACSDLELYLAGLVPISNLRDVFYVLNNPSQVSDEHYKVSSILEISPETIINHYGPRSPSYTESPKEFNFLNIVVSKKPLDKAGLAFFNFLIKEFSNELGVHPNNFKNVSFLGATNYIGKAISRLMHRYTEEITICEGENYNGWAHTGNYSLQIEDTIYVTRLTVNEKPAPAGIIAGDSIICKGTANKLYSIPPINGASAYKWSLPPGATGFSLTNSITISFGENAISGTLKVCGYNECGDGIESTLVLDGTDVPVSFNKNLELKSIFAFPNPTQGFIEIIMDEINESDFKIEVVDLLGKMKILKSENQLNNSIMLDMSSFESGMYLLRITMPYEILLIKIIKK